MGFALSSILFYAYSATFSLHKQMNDSAIRGGEKKDHFRFGMVWYGVHCIQEKKAPINSITISLGGNFPQ